MKLSGWLRLWIVLSVGYLAIVGVVVWLDWPRPENTMHSDAVYERLSADAKHNILNARPTDSNRKALLDEAIRRGIVEEVEMANGYMLVLPKDLSKGSRESATRDYWSAVETEATDRRHSVLVAAFYWWAGPTLLLLVVAYSVGWIYRGFTAP